MTDPTPEGPLPPPRSDDTAPEQTLGRVERWGEGYWKMVLFLTAVDEGEMAYYANDRMVTQDVNDRPAGIAVMDYTASDVGWILVKGPWAKCGQSVIDEMARKAGRYDFGG